MRIDPNDLHLFAQVAEIGNFSRAAELTGIPKSTLSRRIAQLEQVLGERLWQRTTRKLTLTEFGLRLLEHARLIVSETDAAISLAQHRQTEPSGRLRVSMPHDFANLVMGPVLARFMERYVGVSLELDLTARRVDIIGEGYDLALRFGQLPDDATLSSRPIVISRHGLFASPDYLAKRGHPQHPDDLLAHQLLPLLTRNRSVAAWRLQRKGEVWERDTPSRVLANSPELLLDLARRHQGIVSAPLDFARALLESGELVRVLPEWQHPTVTGWAVFPSRRLMPAKTRVFIDMLCQELAEEPD